MGALIALGAVLAIGLISAVGFAISSKSSSNQVQEKTSQEGVNDLCETNKQPEKPVVQQKNIVAKQEKKVDEKKKSTTKNVSNSGQQEEVETMVFRK